MAEPKRKGFSAMDKFKQKEIASKGGKAAHQKGTAHEFTAEEARAAGRKGGSTMRRHKGGNDSADGHRDTQRNNDSAQQDWPKGS